MREVWTGIVAAAAWALSAGAALALPFAVTTTGVIRTGTDPGNLFGAGADLTGAAYTLTLSFSGLGTGFEPRADGTESLIFNNGGVSGTVTATIGGTTISAALPENQISNLLIQRPDALTARLVGLDTALNGVQATQTIGATVDLVAVADLQTPFRYALTGQDSGVDLYTFTSSALQRQVEFTGSEATIALTVPEPTGLAVLGVGLALTIARRRSRSIY